MKKTRRDFLKTVGVTALGAGAVLTGAKKVRAQAKTFKWRMATPWPTGIPLYTDMAKVLPDVVKKESGGRLVIDIFPAGAIAPALEVVDATRRGVCQMAHTWPGYDIGISPVTALLGGYAGSPNSEVMIHWMYQGDGYKLWQEFRKEKFNVVAFPGSSSTECAHSLNRSALADLRVKFRTDGRRAISFQNWGPRSSPSPGEKFFQRWKER
jgi:TRAP-type mannitol/chloroaromatic compound transport system substrate-binding protein